MDFKKYICSKCGAEYDKQTARCQSCDKVGVVVMKPVDDIMAHQAPSRTPPIAITKVKSSPAPRLSGSMSALDRVLGGGIVYGSSILIGGDPGIGKSTLLLQICNNVAVMAEDAKVLYVSAEESISQLKLRADRLDINSPNLFLVCETEIPAIKDYITSKKYSPYIVVIDSIQMVYKPDLGSSAGSVAQIKESAMELSYICKRDGICLFLVCHITKDGVLAGPKTLEHIVDAVLYFEGDTGQSARFLRVSKNRYGPTDQFGLFSMTARGLVEINNDETTEDTDKRG